MPARRFLTCLAFTALAASWTNAPRVGFAEQPSSSKPDPNLQVRRELGVTYAKQAKVFLASVPLNAATESSRRQAFADSELCQQARTRAQKVLAVLDAKASAQVKALALTNLTKAGTAPADVVWDEFAGIAYLRGHPDAALWAEMHALVRNWRAEYVAHAGVYLLSLKNTDDAKLFLHCAYDMGWRSATLLEALALAYDKSGDQSKAREYIVQAQELNPEDQILQAERSLITEGTLPPIPPRKKDDLDWILEELERHFRQVSAELRAAIAVEQQIERMSGMGYAADHLQTQIRWETTTRQEIDRIRQVALPLARMSLDELRKTRFPQASARLHGVFLAYFRNELIFQCVNADVSITINEIQSLTSYYNEGSWSLDLWAHAMHTDMISYARQAEATRAYANPGFVGDIWALDAPGAAGYTKAYREADEIGRHYPDRSREGRIAWCTHMLPAYQAWKAAANSQYQIGADGFDGAGKLLLGWGGAKVADARGYAVRAMRGYSRIEYTPTGNRLEDDMSHSYSTRSNSFSSIMNSSFRLLVERVAGNPQDVRAAIPNKILYNRESFFQNKQDAESRLAAAANTLTGMCSPVAAEVLKKLDGSETDATREELFSELVESLDAKLEQTSWCEFSIGDYASAHITLDWETAEFHTETTAEWEFKKGAESKGGDENWSLYAGTTTVFDSHGDPVQSEVTVGGTASYDILRGYGEVSIVAERDPTTGTWKRMAEVKSSVGLGVGKEHVGEIACYPAELTMKFDPRNVMQKAIRFLGSLDSHNR